MWIEFFKFDMRFQLRQPLLWVMALLFGLLAFGTSTSDAVSIIGSIGNIHRNAPTVIVQLLGTFSVLSLFVVAIFIAGTVLRDAEMGIADLLFATPMRKHDYLFGRFLAGFCACLVIFIFVLLGLLAGPYMPWVDPGRVGAFNLQPFVWGVCLFVLPNLLFISAFLLLLAATTRSMMMVYVGAIGFFVLWIMAGSLATNLNNEWASVLLDPFGLHAFSRMTRYYTMAESNSLLPAADMYLVANRMLWACIAVVMMILTWMIFKPQRAGTWRRWFGKTSSQKTIDPSVIRRKVVLLPVAQDISRVSMFKQFWSLVTFDVKSVFKSLPFIAILLISLLNFNGAVSHADGIFGTSVYPITANMLQLWVGSANFMLFIIIIFYAGELIFKERAVKIANLVDVLPVSNGTILSAKITALVAVVFGFLLVGVAAGILTQLLIGGAPIEFDVYLQDFLIASVSFIHLVVLAIVVQVLVNHKAIGYLIMIVVMMSQFALGSMGFDHNLYLFSKTPETIYSDMNGRGHFMQGWLSFTVYWSLLCAALIIVAQAFWSRGLVHSWLRRARQATATLRRDSIYPLSACLIGFFVVGGWIFYNTNVLNHYQTKTTMLNEKAEYEKKYQQYLHLPHPRLTDISVNVDIFPEEQKAIIHGRYMLKNKSNIPQDALRIQINPAVKTEWLDLPSHEVVLQDKTAGFSILKLNRPLLAGETVVLNFITSIETKGFANTVDTRAVQANGTYLMSFDYLPQFGYIKMNEITDSNERRQRGLGEQIRTPKMNDESARQYHIMDIEADLVNFEATLSTSDDQIAVTSGDLQKSWKEHNRNFYQYKMDKPMMPLFAFLSARWEVKKENYKGISIEIYHDKKHGYNIDRMIESTKKSLDYYTANYAPYQYHQIRIVEFPRFAKMATAFANTIPYSESMGFIADLRNKNNIDYVFGVTAHELAHQWWGHQIVPANVQGAALLTESIAQYSALMVTEKEYGRDKMRRFLKYELDGYLHGRGGEAIEEQPLARTENQPYIHYQKGSLILYRLRDEMGEDALNRALKRFLQDKRFQEAPYPTAQDLLSYIREEAPQDRLSLIDDMFEKIVFYDNRVVNAKAVKREDGKWNLTLSVRINKLEVDGEGKESSRTYDEPVEIGVFGKSADNTEKLLFLEKRQLLNAEEITLTLDEQPFEVGVDPYNKLIDKVPDDNRKEVSF